MKPKSWQQITDNDLPIWEELGMLDNYEYDSEEERIRENEKVS